MIKTIDKSWSDFFSSQAKLEYFKKLEVFIETEYQSKTIFPPKSKIFEALNLCSFDNLKVVVIGQDPYHGAGQAHGLSFSVNDGVKFPPSLRNIFKELKSDLDIEIPVYGNLTKWAKQGVLLINSILTVEESKAGSHKNKGWEQFTDALIEHIAQKKENIVFILWGNFAIKKASIVDGEKNLILSSVHPSPLSASRGFFGTKHFSKTNDYLRSKLITPIDWQLDY